MHKGSDTLDEVLLLGKNAGNQRGLGFNPKSVGEEEKNWKAGYVLEEEKNEQKGLHLLLREKGEEEGEEDRRNRLGIFKK